MKAITLWQPWATLLACRAKQYETRSWATEYRGPIAIHAAQKPAHKIFSEYIEYETSKAMFEYLTPLGIFFPSDLPHGCIVATAELVGCHAMRRSRFSDLDQLTTSDIYFLSDENDLEEVYLSDLGNEYLFGDWTPGRYAWEFVNMKMLPEPIPARGAQGLWNWEGVA